MHNLKKPLKLFKSKRYLALFLVSIIVVIFSLTLLRPLKNQICRQRVPNITTSPEEILKSTAIPGTYYKIPIPPEDSDYYIYADYRLWVPENIANLQGIMVMQHGCGDDGIKYVEDQQWQTFATQHHLALLSSHFLTGNKPCEYWALINYGSENAFLRALHQLATKSDHPELSKIPWILWGHSGGADWATQIFQQYPERTIAMIVARGGGFLFFGVNPSLLNVPVLFSLGQKDPCFEECVELPQKVFAKYREAGAVWTLAIEQAAGHGLGESQSFAIPYLEKILATRLSTETTSLLPVNRDNNWLGDIRTHDITPAGEYRGKLNESSWLPDEDIAKKWQQHVSDQANSSSK